MLKYNLDTRNYYFPKTQLQHFAFISRRRKMSQIDHRLSRAYSRVIVSLTAQASPVLTVNLHDNLKPKAIVKIYTFLRQ